MPVTKPPSDQPGRHITVEEPGRVPYRAWQPAPLTQRTQLGHLAAAVSGPYERHDRTFASAGRFGSGLAARAECFASAAIEDIRPPPQQLARMWPAALKSRPLPSPRTATDGAVWQTRRVVGLWQAMATAGAADDATNRADHQRIEPDWARTVGYGTAGQYRTHRVWIGGSTPTAARYVPPPWDTVPQLMDDLYRWVATQLDERRLPVSLIAAVAHAQYETVHPYSDGNGRAGRLLIRRIHQTAGTGPPPISVAMSRNRRGYYQALDEWRQPGGAVRWLDWYAQQLSAAARTVDRLADRAAQITEQLGQKLETVRFRPASADTARQLIDHLADQPVFTAASAAEATAKSVWSVRNAATKLADIAAVEPLPPTNRRPAAWWNPQIWHLGLRPQ